MIMVNPAKLKTVELDDALLRAPANEALAAIESSGERAIPLVEAWVRTGNAGAVAAVAEHGSGPSRKAARRGLQVLGARGIKVETAPHVAKLGAANNELLTEAWLVPPDPHGIVLIVIATRSATSRTQSGFFYLRSGYGLEEASIGELSGGKLKDALRRAASIGLEPVSIPPAYARQRVAEERKRHAELKLPEPLGLISAGALLEPLPEAPEPHPFDVEGLELSDEDSAELAMKSAALHALPEFRAWLPDRSVVKEMLAQVGKDLGPDETDNPERVNAVMGEAIRAATDRYFSPERRSALLGLMKDSALGVLNAHGEVRALEVVAAMKGIEACGLITNPPHEVPFLRAFFEKAVLTLAAQSGGKLSVPMAGGESSQS
jgi:hypothetical protein